MASLLIVDDDPDLAELVENALVHEGHDCRLAQDGREGLALVEARWPDLVLLDVEMPILDGPDMAQAMFLRNCGTENIPVVLISGIIGLPAIAARVGTPYFLAKPYSLSALSRLVTRALAERIPPHPAPPHFEVQL
jgi:DNA-binding NtrC family response regulator